MAIPFIKCFAKSVFHTQQYLFLNYLNEVQKKNYITYLCCIRQTYGTLRVSTDIQKLIIYQVAETVISKYCEDEFPSMIEYMHYWFHNPDTQKFNSLLVLKDCQNWIQPTLLSLQALVYFNVNKHFALQPFCYNKHVQSEIGKMIDIYGTSATKSTSHSPYSQETYYIPHIAQMNCCQGVIVPNITYSLPRSSDLFLGLIIEDSEIPNIEKIVLTMCEQKYNLNLCFPIELKATSCSHDYSQLPPDDVEKCFTFSNYKLHYFDGLDATKVPKLTTRELYIEETLGKTINMNKVYIVESLVSGEIFQNLYAHLNETLI